MSASVAVRGEHVFSMIHAVSEFAALAKFNLAFRCNNCNHANDRATAGITSYNRNPDFISSSNVKGVNFWDKSFYNL